MPLEITVIGAGLAGLSAARELGLHGHRVRVLDKGRGPGGRATSRHRAGFSFDHGAQYFTARDERFLEFVHGWQRAGLVAPWRARIVSLDEGTLRPLRRSTERFVAVPTMSALAKHLAQGLDLASGVEVTSCSRRAGRWELTGPQGAQLGDCDRLVLALPPAQAAALLGADSCAALASSPLHRAREAQLEPCWAAMLGFEQRFEVEFDAAFVERSGLSWIARNASKPGRPAGEAWVLHATPEWTRAHDELQPSEIPAALGAELVRVTGCPLPRTLHSDAHRWRYAIARPALEVGALSDPARGLVLAGDWCHGARVEGAFLSGLETAKTLLEAHHP